MMILLYCFLSLWGWASDKVELSLVTVECSESTLCSEREKRFQSLVGSYRSLVHLKNSMEILASDGGYQSFNFKILKQDNTFHLKIHLKLKPIINGIKFNIKGHEVDQDPMRMLSLKEGEFYEKQKVRDEIDLLKKKFEELGFPEVDVSSKMTEEMGGVNIRFIVLTGAPLLFKKINIETKSAFIDQFIKSKYLRFYNKPFNLNQFKFFLDDAQRELFKYGYFLLNFTFKTTTKAKRVIVQLNCEGDELYAFDLKNFNHETRLVLHDLLRDQFVKFKRPLSEAMIRSSLQDHFRKKAFLEFDATVEIQITLNKFNEKLNVYRITATEKSKTVTSRIIFKGEKFFDEKKLHHLYQSQAFELARSDFYDEEYLDYFQEYLRGEYVRHGFVQVKVYDPVVVFKNDRAIVEYTINEGEQTLVKDILIEGVSDLESEQILSRLNIKKGSYFNPLILDDEIKSITTFYQEKGYYFVEIQNVLDSNLVQYSKNAALVRLHFKIQKGPLLTFNRALYMGNYKTKRKVLDKRMSFSKNEIITPSKVREIESSLSATGLFNSVTVVPLRHQSHHSATDLLVKVLERDYGLIEIAPGYRTDLGLKLTGTISYQNLGGYNRFVSLKGQINKRTSYTTLDPLRRDKQDNFLEHNTSLTYGLNDLFDKQIEGVSSISYLTRRFYSFDANILRWNATLSKDFTKHFSTSIRYQYEDINQYNATQEINNGSFQIGSITPAVTFDYRDSQTLPLKGALFNFSTELAHPFLGSQETENLHINYYKFLSRNRFYLPFKNGTVAVSLTAGVQQNLTREMNNNLVDQQTRGYIPTIKVFRLTGMDIIRGYTDEEQNRLRSGVDISQYRVDNRAYIGLFKIEPRYLINDSLMAGVFYDAGAVAVNSLDAPNLRDAAGLTFKIITPVGTLDFDYGIKLLRKRTPSGTLEDPGRFHVSIGFF